MEDPFYSRQPEVVVVHPHSFEAGCDALLHVREQKTLLVDLSGLEPAIGQRVVDFLTGAIYALDGTAARIGEQVFLFAPESTSFSRD